MNRVHRVDTARGAIQVIEHPGDEPAIVMLHGFPDDSRIYQRLIPLLAPRRAVAFDWLGYGRSARFDSRNGAAAPHGGDARTSIAPADHELELTAVLDALGIDHAVLVGHDAGGPDAVNFALHHPDRVAQLTLLNTYYGTDPALRLPEMIRLFADPHLTPLADAMLADPEQRQWLLTHSAKRFGYESIQPDGVAANSILPQFFGGPNQPDALAAIRGWTGNLFKALEEQDALISAGAPARLEMPVSLIFGRNDRYLSPTLASNLAQLFRRVSVHLVDDASHWPQWDQPAAVAKLLTRALAP